MSAFDLNVGSTIMESTIMNCLKNDTVIITTHAIQYANLADRIIIMDEGRIVSDGTYDQVKHSELFLELKNFYKNQILKEKSVEESKKQPVFEKSDTLKKKLVESLEDVNNTDIKCLNKLFLEEDREIGGISSSVYKKFVQMSLGWWLAIIFITLTLLTQVVRIISNNYLLDWSKDFFGPKAWFHFEIWALITISFAVCTGLRWLPMFRGLKMFRDIHSKIIYRILHCKINEFFERVPIGIILNRFSNDIYVIDLVIFFTNMGLTCNASYLLFDLIVILYYTNIWSILFIIGFLIISVYLQRKYMYCKRELLRQELITRSPIAGLISDVLKGLPEIRAMNLENYFKGK